MLYGKDLPNGRSLPYNFSSFLDLLPFFSYQHVISSLPHLIFLVSVFLEISFLPFFPVLLPLTNLHKPTYHQPLKRVLSNSSSYISTYSSVAFLLQLIFTTLLIY